MTLINRSSKILASFTRQKARLAMPYTATPAILLIPVGFMCLLLIFVSVETNPRLFSTAKPVQLVLEEFVGGRLWYSVAPYEQGIRIISDSGKFFDLQGEINAAALTEFSSHLKLRMQKILADVAVANRMDKSTSFVILSVDERLTYSHLRPVIYALADAGVTRYAFESRILKN
ncbi:MAG: hypothetical protein NTV34_13505 [Proteobacteria bacterium]|nr:hypothetical protein [Pseudomonadota bacterium]